MTLEQFLAKIKQDEPISFDETMAVIVDNYDYQPTEFNNGLLDDILINPAGTNEGSCKIFAFAKIHGLTVLKTLNLFGDFYRNDVLANPTGTGHQNIRNFMKYGWQGIHFSASPLHPRN